MPKTAKDILAAAPQDRLRLLRDNMETLSAEDLNEIIRSVTTSVTTKLSSGMPELVAESYQALERGAADDAPLEVDDQEAPAAPEPLVLTERVADEEEAPAVFEAETDMEAAAPVEAESEIEDDGEGYETEVLHLPNDTDDAAADLAQEDADHETEDEGDADEVAPVVTTATRTLTFDRSEFDDEAGTEVHQNDPDGPQGEPFADHVVPQTVHNGTSWYQKGPKRAEMVARRAFEELTGTDEPESGATPKPLRERVLGMLPIPTAVFASYVGTDPISAAISAPPKFDLVVAIVILLMVSWLVCEATRIDARRNASLSVKLAAALSCYYPIEALGRAISGQALTTADFIYLIVPATLGLSVLWTSLRERKR